MGNQQWGRAAMAATFVDEVNVDTLDFCEEVVELAEPISDSTEVIVVSPVVNQFLLVGQRQALTPVFNRFGIGEAGGF